MGPHSFLAEVGIRQGCPLSPLIFALVADILLRIVTARFGQDAKLWAFADDTAVVLKSTSRLQELFQMFEDYGIFSNRKLNLEKQS